MNISGNDLALNKELESMLFMAEACCMYYLKNKEDAQDISQSVIMEFYSNYDKIKNPQAWIRTVSRNKCYGLMRRNTKYREMLEDIEVEHQLVSAVDFDDIKTDRLSFEKLLSSIPDNYLSQQDKELLMNYVKSGRSLKEWLKITGYSYERGRKKLYTIRRDLVAWVNQYRNIVRGKELIGGHLNENIITFINSFQKAVASNNWDLLSGYFAPDLKIPEMFELPLYEERDYHVYRIRKNEFRLTITYFHTKEQGNGFFFELKIKPPHSILITRFPQPVEKIVKLPLGHLPQEIREALQPLADGSYRYNKKELDALFEKYNIKLKTIFESSQK